MALEKVYVIPHGDELLSLPNEESRIMNDTIKKIANDDRSTSIVIISPHSLRLNKEIPVINTRFLSGYYRIGDRILRRRYESNRELNREIIMNCENSDEVNFITTDGRMSLFPLDFGSLIPLQFFHVKSISVIGQWRSEDRKALVDFGRCLYKIVESRNEKVSVIFSADQAHTHDLKGPYGYSKYAKTYDDLIIRSVKDNDFSELLTLDEEVLEKAKPDSFWNMLSYFGFIREASLVPRFGYYYVQEYFGMMFAYSANKT